MIVVVEGGGAECLCGDKDLQIKSSQSGGKDLVHVLLDFAKKKKKCAAESANAGLPG